MLQLPKRKHPRLDNYDYSSAGAYFVTICTQGKRCTLSRIVGRGLAPAAVEYTRYGEIALRKLSALEERFPFLTVDRFVIMPNHIHVILLFDEAAGAEPPPYNAHIRPTLMDVICAYKSITAKECKKIGYSGRLFQTSFHEHIIRGKEDYEQIAKYIFENPIRWDSDELYIKEQ